MIQVIKTNIENSPKGIDIVTNHAILWEYKSANDANGQHLKALSITSPIFGDFTMKTRNYTVSVNVDLYNNSNDGKFDAFADRISGSNISLVRSRPTDEGRAYTFKCSEQGVAILLNRWTKRLGSGMRDATVKVFTA